MLTVKEIKVVFRLAADFSYGKMALLSFQFSPFIQRFGPRFIQIYSSKDEMDLHSVLGMLSISDGIH